MISVPDYPISRVNNTVTPKPLELYVFKNMWNLLNQGVLPPPLL